MSFVDGDAGEFFLLVDELEAVAEAVDGAELWRHVQEAGAGVASGKILVDVVSLSQRGVAVESSGVDVGGSESLDLVHLCFRQLVARSRAQGGG